jgi:rhomboid family GlyGly-CTERM serine protease
MRRIGSWQVPLLLGASATLAAFGGEPVRALLRWDRDAIAAGEAWRLVTGHIAHLGAPHLLLNLAGLVLVWLLVGERLRARRWWLVTAVTIATIDAGFWRLDPALSWYVGLSGVLHGLLAAGVAAGFAAAPVESAVLAAAVAAKLAFEQLYGPLPGSEATSGGPVIVSAHLYGAVAGALAGAAMTYIMPALPKRRPDGGIP